MLVIPWMCVGDILKACYYCIVLYCIVFQCRWTGLLDYSNDLFLMHHCLH